MPAHNPQLTGPRAPRRGSGRRLALALALAGGLFGASAHAGVLATYAGPINQKTNPNQVVIPAGTISRDDTDSDTLYFRWTITAHEYEATESYWNGLELRDGGTFRLGVGNNFFAFAYSIFSNFGDLDLNSADPEPGQSYENVSSGDETTFLMRVDYVAGGDDNVTVYLDPDFNLNEGGQPAALKTTFATDMSFDQVETTGGAGAGLGWDYRDIVVADAAGDVFVDPDSDSDGMPDNWESGNGLVVGVDDSAGDADSNGGPDGLTNLEEFLAGTDPQEADSDGDLYGDGEEVGAGTNPGSAASFPGANQDLIGIEAFNYADGPIAGRKGGWYWDFDNSTGNDPFQGHSGEVSAWLNVDGAPQVSGGVLVTQESSAQRRYHGGLEEAGSISGEATSLHQQVYYKFEMTRRAGATWGGASIYENGVERYLIGVPFVVNPGSGNREFAIHDLALDQWSYTGVAPVVGQTYTVVGVFDAASDEVRLYLDPDLSLSEPVSADASYSADPAHETTAIRFGSGGTGNVEWDRVRVAANWDGLYDGPPTPVADAATMRLGAQARLRVLENDGGSLDRQSVTIGTPPTFGTATPQRDGSVVYEHTTGTPAGDSFTYAVTNDDGTAAASATVTITFTAAARFDTDYANIPLNPPALSLSVVQAFPGLIFDTPHGISSIPGDSGKLLVAEAAGKVFLIPDVGASPTNADKIEILDISGQVAAGGELAMKGIAAHPDWANNGYIYATYNSTAGTVRVSRFTCQTTAPYTAGSELVLIDQAHADNIHNIATCHFGPDGYLYVGFGDEGTQSDGYDNSQHIDKDLWSCLIRIDVDKDPSNLIPNDDPDIPRVGMGSSGEAHFRVPADNPHVWATSFNGVTFEPSSIVRTEIVAMGLRNPWQVSPEDIDGDGDVDELWVGDVGRNARDEISVLPLGGNGGWAWREGTQGGIRSGQIINGADEDDATLTEPRWDYAHGTSAFQGRSVTGGFIYRGTAVAALTGQFVFGDYISGNVWSLDPAVGAPMPGAGVERIGGIPAVLGFEVDPATGDILGLSRNGQIWRISEDTPTGTFPQLLSETNFFADLDGLTPNPGGHFYDPNLRFWSDHAEKKRWFLVEEDADTVGYAEDDPWTYPTGMIWVKHFDYPTQWTSYAETIGGQLFTGRKPQAGSPRRRLETRVLVRNATGAYGVSYRWNNLNSGTQTDAVLASNNGEGMEVEVTLDGSPATVTWEIPSRSTCIVCHTPQAGHALSFNTRQLNTDGGISGLNGNFLEVLRDAGYLAGFLGEGSERPRHLAPDEDTYSLEARVRSYLDVNCAYCHKSGGTGGGAWDARHHLTLAETGLINGVPADAPVNPGDLIVLPGAVNQSILYNRLAATNGYTRMPPVATEVVDLEGARLLADWIASEVQSETTYDEWRLARFGNTTSSQGEPGANPDGDPRNNYFEWLTNTDPLDFASAWLPDFDVSGGQVTVSFEGLGNRSVTVLRSDDLENWSPWAVPGNEGIPLSPSLNHLLSAPQEAPENYFKFRIEAR